MKKDIVCQEELEHKIWGAVSVIITRRNMECFLGHLFVAFRKKQIVKVTYNSV